MTMDRSWRTTASRARSAVRRLLSPDSRASVFPVNRATTYGFVDSVKADPAGIISIQGWSKAHFEAADAPAVAIDGTAVPYLQHFRTARRDVAGPTALLSQMGLELQYLVPSSMVGKRCKMLTVQLSASDVLEFDLGIKFVNPHYRELLHSSTVFHREDIYGSGPPNSFIHPDVVELATQLTGPVLDFGTGRGALIEVLLREGIDASGIELDVDLIRQSIPKEIAHRITLYDGRLPTDFHDGSFRSVICSEVLEHIPNYEDAVKEIARLASERVLITVPDISAIPLNFRHGTVPWHLLELTHVNFFNQESLQKVLAPYFSKIEFSRVGAVRINDSSFYVSIAALCDK